MDFNPNKIDSNMSQVPKRIDVLQLNSISKAKRQQLVDEYVSEYRAAHPIQYWITNQLWKTSLTLVGMGFILPRILSSDWIQKQKWMYLTMTYRRYFLAERVSTFGFRMLYGLVLISFIMSYNERQYFLKRIDPEELKKLKEYSPESQL